MDWPGVAAGFLTGIAIGVAVTIMAGRSQHPVIFDWRLQIRRNIKEDNEEDESPQ